MPQSDTSERAKKRWQVILEGGTKKAVTKTTNSSHTILVLEEEF